MSREEPPKFGFEAPQFVALAGEEPQARDVGAGGDGRAGGEETGVDCEATTSAGLAGLEPVLQAREIEVRGESVAVFSEDLVAADGFAQPAPRGED